MIKLNRQIDSLESAIEKIEEKIKNLAKKRNAIEEKAAEDDREFTGSELKKFYELGDQIEELEGELDDIEIALEYLRHYYVE